MDQLWNIYANVEEPADEPNTRKQEMQSSESIYENVIIHTLETNRTGPALSGAKDVKKSSCRAAAASLLCVLLLTGLISLVFLLIKSNSERVTEMVLLHNLTKERDQLQTCYNNLMKERDQLQTCYNNLTKERDQLQTCNNNLTKERDQLQTCNNNLTKERDQLQTCNNNLTKERDQQASLNQMATEKDQLQGRFDALTKNRNDHQREPQAKTSHCISEGVKGQQPEVS